MFFSLRAHAFAESFNSKHRSTGIFAVHRYPFNSFIRFLYVPIFSYLAWCDRAFLLVFKRFPPSLPPADQTIPFNCEAVYMNVVLTPRLKLSWEPSWASFTCFCGGSLLRNPRPSLLLVKEIIYFFGLLFHFSTQSRVFTPLNVHIGSGKIPRCR